MPTATPASGSEPAESVRDAIKAQLDARRADPEFQERLKIRIEADREILSRLEEPDHG